MSLLKKLKQLWKKLKQFVTEAHNPHQAAANHISKIFTVIGAITILVGIILIICNNWYEMDGLFKITIFLLILVATHFAATKINHRFPKSSHILYVIGAGLIIVGIGLVIQAYGLKSNDGIEYLIWFILILPLAILLRSMWIGALSIFAFYVWVITYLSSQGAFFGHQNTSANIAVIAISLICLPFVLKSSSECLKYIRTTGGVLLAILLALLSFSNNASYLGLGSYEFHPLILLIFGFNLVVIIMNFIDLTRSKKKLNVEAKGLVLLGLITLFTISSSYHSSALLTSTLAWILWFLASFWLVLYGRDISNKKYVSLGVITFAIGIVLRFVDIFDGVLDSGSILPISGIVLVLVGFLARKYLPKYLPKSLTK